MSYLNKLQQEAKERHLQKQCEHKRRISERKDDEAWEAKVRRIKQTAEKVNKAIGYYN